MTQAPRVVADSVELPAARCATSGFAPAPPRRAQQGPTPVPRHHGLSGVLAYAGGACSGYGLLLDINDPAHPRRIARRPTPTWLPGTP